MTENDISYKIRGSIYQVYKVLGPGLLESVYEEFGQYSAWKLRNMTHKETPWLSTKKNDVIRLDVIEKYFKDY